MNQIVKARQQSLNISKGKICPYIYLVYVIIKLLLSEYSLNIFLK